LSDEGRYLFIDQARMSVRAGSGGNGCVSFRREKFVPRGGPDGGDGGKGGDLILAATNRLRTLHDYRYRHLYAAERGRDGQGARKTGRSGQDLVLEVPVGTLVREESTGELLGDLTADGQQLVVARGGRGGRGNIHFATSSHRVPRKCTPGEPAEERLIRLELKLLADVGLVGFPNVGKSTLINQVSRASSPVAPYPFTTLTPHLGVVTLSEDDRFIIADIPGIIEGAHTGTGLGLQFLRHVERTRVLLHLVEVSPEAERDPVEDYRILRVELAAHGMGLAGKPELVVATKIDVPGHERNLAAIEDFCRQEGRELFAISALEKQGLADLLWRCREVLRTAEEEGGP
jgi:GTPase